MSIFDVLTMIGGLCLFLFGMNIMGQALERRAGGKLHTVLGKLANNKAAGFFTGMGVTSVIQSSSATTVMVVGFVNSGIMTLKQAKEKLRTSHIRRLSKGECSIEAGFVWSDLLNNLERISDHCSNIAGCIIEAAHNDLTLHEGLKGIRSSSNEYFDKYKEYHKKYQIVS